MPKMTTPLNRTTTTTTTISRQLLRVWAAEASRECSLAQPNKTSTEQYYRNEGVMGGGSSLSEPL